MFIPAAQTVCWDGFASIDRSMDVHYMKLTQIAHALDTQLVIPGHHKKILPA